MILKMTFNSLRINFLYLKYIISIVIFDMVYLFLMSIVD